MSELKPCPFCGSKSITVGYFGQPAQTIFAACRTCGANGPTHQYYGGIGSPVIDLGESWNRRTPASEGERIQCSNDACQFHVARRGEPSTICPRSNCGMLILAKGLES
ncbi:TPA: Lar family restriction alleviation protein [Burkholderia vietnamiensis]|nr:Lar family restriction alleviation protein [Burkholderia vietnamiensis]